MIIIDNWNENIVLKLKELDNLYVYGAGLWGGIIIRYCIEKKINVNAIVVSDLSNNIDEIYEIPVIEWSDEICKINTTIIVAVNGSAGDVICRELVKKGINNVIKMATVPDGYHGYDWNIRLDKKMYPLELKQLFWERTKRVLDLNNPTTFNEKNQWSKLYSFTPFIAELADKYKVRKWVSDRVGEEVLIPLVGVWDSFDEIDFDALPNQFVIKCNHGSGMNYIVKDKDKVDCTDIKKKIENWMCIDYEYYGFEMQYGMIKKKIIVEQYMENGDGDLYDYKFWCFNGEVKFIMFLSEREKGLKMNNYDKDWKLLPFTYNYPNNEKEIKKPQNLKRMIEIAEQLSVGFPFVRVDLYSPKDGTIKFGEMTFTPASGMCKWSNDVINRELGDLYILT